MAHFIFTETYTQLIPHKVTNTYEIEAESYDEAIKLIFKEDLELDCIGELVDSKKEIIDDEYHPIVKHNRIVADEDGYNIDFDD